MVHWWSFVLKKLLSVVEENQSVCFYNNTHFFP